METWMLRVTFSSSNRREQLFQVWQLQLPMQVEDQRRITNLSIIRPARKSLIIICITKILYRQEYEMSTFKIEEAPTVRRMPIWASVREGITVSLDTRLQLPLVIHRFHQPTTWFRGTTASQKFRVWAHIHKLLHKIKSLDWYWEARTPPLMPTNRICLEMLHRRSQLIINNPSVHSRRKTAIFRCSIGILEILDNNKLIRKTRVIRCNRDTVITWHNKWLIFKTRMHKMVFQTTHKVLLVAVVSDRIQESQTLFT